MYHESGKYSAAMESFTKAARLSPSLFVPQLFLGIEYLAARNPEAAIPHLEEAARLNPQDVQAFRSLGKAYSLQGQSDRAADAYWKTTELAPNDGSSWFDLGTAYLQQVENDARVMNSTYGDSAYAKLRAAEALAEEGKMIPSQEAYKTALALQSSIPCGFAEFGIALLRTREIAKAREEFEQEIRAGSGCGLAALGLAVVDLASGDPGGALTRLTPIAKAESRVFARKPAAFSRRSLSRSSDSSARLSAVSTECSFLIRYWFVHSRDPLIRRGGAPSSRPGSWSAPRS